MLNLGSLEQMEENSVDIAQLGPSVVPEEGLDDHASLKALMVGVGGMFIVGVFFAVGAAILGKNLLKKIINRQSD